MLKLATCRLESMSVSFARTLPDATLSSFTAAASATATVASSTAFTVMASALLTPVAVVYVTCGTVPFQSAAGVKLRRRSRPA
ncbi:hypothetical protein [Ramlibacter montanisoli]|uniref:hypothetical protein n=1 Tax=Ramlibacter montanisoli TaxID=2732512 RepID=UPI00209BF80C|nr:hypothetical protein [Ramlibacter montanisoli]